METLKLKFRKNKDIPNTPENQEAYYSPRFAPSADDEVLLVQLPSSNIMAFQSQKSDAAGLHFAVDTRNPEYEYCHIKVESLPEDAVQYSCAPFTGVVPEFRPGCLLLATFKYEGMYKSWSYLPFMETWVQEAMWSLNYDTRLDVMQIAKLIENCKFDLEFFNDPDMSEVLIHYIPYK